MPGIVERFVIKIDAQTGGAISEFRKVSKSADDLGKSSGIANKAINALGLQGKVSGQALTAGVGVAAGAAAVALVGFAKAGVAAQRDLQEQISATSVVFGKSATEVQNWAKGGAQSFGQSQRAALEAANGFGTLFSTLSLGEGLTAKFAEGFTQLAADLASLKNTSIEEATQALKSGLVGEAEPLRKYAVLLTETAVKNKALELGIRGSNGVLSEQEKIFVRSQIILQQTGIAQGNFAQTSNDLANQQRILAAQTENLTAAFGRALIPATTEGVRILNGLAFAIEKGGDKAKSSGLLDFVKDVGADFATRTVPLLGSGIKILHQLGQSSDEASDGTTKFANAQEQAAAATAIYAQLLFTGASSSKELKAAQVGLASASAKAAAEQRALAEAMKTPEQKAQEQKAAVDSLRGALLGAADAERGVANADRGIRDASERVSDARQRLNELMRKGRVDTEAVSDAQYQLAQASRTVTSAQEDLARAQERLITLRSGGDPEDRDDANRSVAGALLGVERAHRRVADAQKSLNEARKKGDADDIADAELSLREAQLGVAEAEDSLQESQARLNEATGQGAEGAKALSEAQRAVRDAELQVEAAQRGRHDAQVALNKAQEGDLSLTGQIRDAKRNLRDAEQGLTDARDAGARARLDYATAQDAENKLLQTGGAAASVLLGQLNSLVSTYPQLHPILDDIIAKVTLAVTGGPRSSGPFGGPLHRRAELGDGVGGSHVGHNWQSVVQSASASGIPFSVSSTVRPGARTSTGNVSLHALGKAVDFGGSATNLSALFDYFAHDPGVREMFYSPKGYGLVRGRHIPNAQLSGSIVKDHYNHVHVGVYHGGGEFRADTPGGEGLAILRDREVVLTPEQARAGGGTTVVHIHMPPGSDGDSVVEAFRKWERRNGPYRSN